MRRVRSCGVRWRRGILGEGVAAAAGVEGFHYLKAFEGVVDVGGGGGVEGGVAEAVGGAGVGFPVFYGHDVDGVCTGHEK